MGARRSFTFSAPGVLEFGIGVVENVGPALGSKGFSRALLVSDPGVAAAGILGRVMDSLSGAGLKFDVFHDVEPNPQTLTVDRALDLYVRARCDIVIGVGGGSPLDVAKGVAILATNGGSMGDYEGMGRVSAAPAPTAAIPTTAGTGSEVTQFVVISDRARRAKMTIGSDLVPPRWVWADPGLTVGMPPALTAATGLDALTHAIESYTNTVVNPVADCLALEAVRLTGRNLRLAVEDGSDLEARYGMLLASTMAGLAFTRTRLGIAHALAHPLGAFFDLPHGVVNAVLLPHVMQFNAPACPERMAVVARALDAATDRVSRREAASMAVAAVRRLCADVGIPLGLRELGVTEEALPDITEQALRSGNVQVNPRPVTPEELVAILRAAM